MLSITQILTFEVGQGCNLINEHKNKCPILLITRTNRVLSDDIIVSMAVEAYTNLGFEGFIGWSFYSEPMIYYNRILTLMEAIRSKIPKSKFILWTNGTILIEDPRHVLFDRIFVTNYHNTNIGALIKCFGDKVLWKGDPQLDDRIIRHEQKLNYKRCLTPISDFIVSNTGEVYFCCQDWKNEIKIGSVFDKSLKELAEIKWNIVKEVSCKPTMINGPNVCHRCNWRWDINSIDIDIYKKAIDKIKEIENGK